MRNNCEVGIKICEIDEQGKGYEKLGFKEIGIIRQGYFDSRTGNFQDVLFMDMLKSEWNDRSHIS